MRLFRTLLLLLGLAPSLAAQLPSHAYIPLDHWSMPYLEHLVDRRVLTDPTPMVRPWTVAAVRKALADIDPADLSADEMALVRRLRETFVIDAEWVGVSIEADVGVWGASHRRLNSDLRQVGDGNVFPRFSGNATLQSGNVALVMHPRWDPNFQDDPDYGGRDVAVKVIYPEAYGALRTRFVDVDFGRLRRNWGPVGFPGLLVSSVPYSYDHLYIRAGPDQLYLQMFISQIDDMVNDQGEQSRRYWVAHRLIGNFAKILTLSAWEGSIVSGPNRTFEMWYLNPVALQFQGEDEQNRSTNVLIGGDGELRIPGGPRLSGSLTIDDLQLFRSTRNNEPASYALTGTVVWPVKRSSIFLGYTQVSNLSYRTPDPSEALLIDQNLTRGHVGAGLARNFTDYDQTTLKVKLMPVSGVLLSPEITVLRQGEGDLRRPFPPASLNAVTPTLFDGVVETTWRFALGGEMFHRNGLRLSFNAGVHHVRDAGHVDGATSTDLVARFHLRYMFGNAWPLH